MQPANAGTSNLLQTLNATPMMDVMLVLLVVFMVVTPLIHSGPDLVLPTSANGDPVPEADVLTIRLSRTGEVRSETGIISRADLIDSVARNPDITLLIEADHQVQYSYLERVLTIAGEAGLSQVTLVALRSTAN